jgi:hypothetical protein
LSKVVIDGEDNSEGSGEGKKSAGVSPLEYILGRNMESTETDADIFRAAETKGCMKRRTERKFVVQRGILGGEFFPFSGEQKLTVYCRRLHCILNGSRQIMEIGSTHTGRGNMRYGRGYDFRDIGVVLLYENTSFL